MLCATALCVEVGMKGNCTVCKGRDEGEKPTGAVVTGWQVPCVFLVCFVDRMSQTDCIKYVYVSLIYSF
jgi:hypothetical protein